MILPFSTPFKDSAYLYAYKEKVFTKEECEKIIKIGKLLKPIKATVGDEGRMSKIRRSKISWLAANADTQWIYSAIAETALKLNDKYFKFDIRGFTEPLQFSYYNSRNKGHYNYHIDSGADILVRKLSLSIQLSPPTYKGGDIVLKIGSHKEDVFKMIRTQGSLIAFPSYALHKVSPVTKGERYSLVSWLTGPSFK